MPRSSLFLVLAATFLSLATLYGPQPLLPIIAQVFQRSDAEAATLITWSLLAMSIGPFFVGLLMQVLPPRKLLAWSLLLLGITDLLFYATPVFAGLQALRFVQGALVSSLLASVMTYIASQATRLRHVMAGYVASSVAGGLMGRILAGFLTTYAGWSDVFLVLGILQIACSVATTRLPPEPIRPYERIRPSRLFSILRRPLVVSLYGVVFSAFFVLTALLNYIPFRLKELDAALGEGAIAMSYTGFILGIVASLSSPRLVGWLRAELRVVALGFVFVVLAVLVAWGDHIANVVVCVCLLTAGFFVMHAVTAGFLNARAGREAGAVNSLYVAIYYTGGTLGSYVPGIVYGNRGWTPFILILLGMAAVGLTLLAWAMFGPYAPTAEAADVRSSG